MGINVRVQNVPKPDGIIAAQVSLEKDLKDCMRCRFFYGNNSQCIAKKCVREESKPEITEQDKEDMCFGCPYRLSEQYCLPHIYSFPIGSKIFNSPHFDLLYIVSVCYNTDPVHRSD